MPELVRRVGGRLLLIDPDGRLLLIHERTDDGAATFWITPGGGLEPGETPQQAAVRETYEETGIEITLLPDAPVAHSRVRSWRGDGVTYEQTDHFFTVSVAAGLTFAPAGLTDVERDLWLGNRWWTPAELRASDETFVPADVAELVQSVGPISRTAGRVLLIESYVDVGTASTHWITPGGGAEPGESPADAAARELLEETGVRVELGDADAVHVDRESFTFNGRVYEQTNHYFVVQLRDGRGRLPGRTRRPGREPRVRRARRVRVTSASPCPAAHSHRPFRSGRLG